MCDVIGRSNIHVRCAHLNTTIQKKVCRWIRVLCMPRLRAAACQLLAMRGMHGQIAFAPTPPLPHFTALFIPSLPAAHPS